jgi:hypothetical protein
MRVALIVMLASLLLLIGWISMRMARNPEPGRRRSGRGGYIPHDGASHGRGDGNGGGGGDGGGGD